MKFDHQLLEIIIVLNEIFEKIIVFSGSNYWPVVDGLSVLFGDSGTLKFFRRIITSDLLKGEVGKPDKQAYEQMLEKCDINPETALLVDDSPVEIVTAREMEMKTILVGNHSSSAVKYAQPDAQIENIYGLLAILVND